MGWDRLMLKLPVDLFPANGSLKRKMGILVGFCCLDGLWFTGNPLCIGENLPNDLFDGGLPHFQIVYGQFV